MRTRDLKIFISVCEEKSFTETARKLYLAQPSVSRTIAGLEKAYDSVFFERTAKPIQLTESGKAFLAYARRMMDLEEELKEELRVQGKRTKIRIGSSITIGTYLLPRLIKVIEVEMPDLQIEVVIDNSRRILERLDDNTIDLGLVEHMVEHPMIKVRSVMTDRMVMVASKDNPITSLSHEKLSDLNGQRFVLRERGSASRDLLEAMSHDAQMEMNIVWESISNEALVKAVEDNIGITALSQYIVQDGINEGSLKEIVIHGVDMKRYFHLIYHEKKSLSPAREKLMNLLTHHMAQFEKREDAEAD